MEKVIIFSEKMTIYRYREVICADKDGSVHLRKDVQSVKLDNNVKSLVSWTQNQSMHSMHRAKKQSELNAEKIPAAEREPAAILDLSRNAFDLDERNCILKALEKMRPQNNDNANSNVEDPTRGLTRRLVAARTTIQVQNVLRDAFKAMGDLITASAAGCDEAEKILRRLQRLIRRASRKVRDLNNEAELRRKEDQARKREMENLARKFEEELRRRVAERRRREESYLRDNDSNDNTVLPIPGFLSGVPSEAQIKAMAQQAAQAVVAAQAASVHSHGGGFGGGNPASGAGSVSMSGEVTSGEGDGSVSVE